MGTKGNNETIPRPIGGKVSKHPVGKVSKHQDLETPDITDIKGWYWYRFDDTKQTLVKVNLVTRVFETST